MFVPPSGFTVVDWEDFSVTKGGVELFLSRCRWEVDGVAWHAKFLTRNRNLVVCMIDGGLFGHPSVN